MPVPEDCGSCSLCCKLLQIDPEPEVGFEGKGWNRWCKHCKPGALPGGCQRYLTRPQACQAFECIWLQSQRRDDVPTLPRDMKPVNSHVVLVQSQEDYDVLFAFVDPAYPRAFREEPTRSHLIQVAQAGCTVVVVVNRDRFIMTKDRPTIKVSESQLAALVKGELADRVQKGEVRVAKKTFPKPH